MQREEGWEQHLHEHESEDRNRRVGGGDSPSLLADPFPNSECVARHYSNKVQFPSLLRSMHISK